MPRMIKMKMPSVERKARLGRRSAAVRILDGAASNSTLDIYVVLAAILLLWLLPVPGTEAFTVYDCESQFTDFTTVDLTEPRQCPDPVKDYRPPMRQRLQLVQSDSSVPMKGYQCLVTTTKTATKCGFDSVTYGSAYPAWKKQVEITPAECRNAVEKGQIEVRELGRSFKVEKGTVETFNYYSHGKVNDNGACEVENFLSEGKVFNGYYEFTSVDIEVRAIRGWVDTAESVVSFVGQHQGLTAPFADGILRDVHAGTIVWNSTKPSCKSTVSEVWEGYGDLHRRVDSFQNEPNFEAILMMKDDSDERYAGLVLGKTTSICGTQCYTTQIKGLVACLLREQDQPIPDIDFKAYFNPTQANLQTQLGFLHADTNMRMGRRFEVIQKDLCDLDRRVLYNKLQSISGARNMYAMLDVYGPGYALYMAGAAAYLTRCEPVEATRADFGNCTEEIPVLVNETVRFADPFTYILKDHPTVVPCSMVMPVRWLISGTWYCASPHAAVCDRPEKLATRTTGYRPTGNYAKALGKGAWTLMQLMDHLKFQKHYSARAPAAAKITNTMMDGALPGGGMGMPMSKDEVKSVAYTVGSELFPGFALFGSFWHAISTFLLIMMLLKLFVGCMWRTYILYRERGCGWWLLGALWSTAFSILRAPVDLVRATLKAIKTPMHREDAAFRMNSDTEDDDTEAGRSGTRHGRRGAKRRRDMYPTLFLKQERERARRMERERTDAAALVTTEFSSHAPAAGDSGRSTLYRSGSARMGGTSRRQVVLPSRPAPAASEAEAIGLQPFQPAQPPPQAGLQPFDPDIRDGASVTGDYRYD